MKTIIGHILDTYEVGQISRRTLIESLVALAGVATAEGAESQFRGGSLNHVTIFVSDLQRSTDFYQRILGLPILKKQAKNNVILGLGKSFMALDQRDKPEINHFCVGVEKLDIKSAFARLKKEGLDPELRRGGQELYFRDPDGILVQISSPDYRG